MSSRVEPLPAGGEAPRRRWWSALTGPRARMIGIVTLAALNSALVVIGGARAISPTSVSLWGWHPPLVVVITAAVAAPVALLWRRRAPVLVTAVTALAFVLSSTLLPVGFALLTVAVQRRDWVLWACTAGVAAAFWLTDGSADPAFVDAGLSLVLASFWALWGSYVGARRALLQSLRDRARRAEEEQLARAEQARQTERSRIAREMHDIVAHKVSLIALQAGGLEVNAQLSPERVAGTAAQIRTTAREALEDLRGVLGVLRAADVAEGAGGELLPQPGLDDIVTLVDRSRSAGLPVSLTMDPAGPDGEPVAPSSGRTAYRVVQEALTNVTKHARGAASTVTVERLEGVDARAAGVADPGPVLVVTVVNRRPVAAGSLLPGSGAGLIGLRERVDLVGGRLSAGPTTEGGWQVRAVLPVVVDGSVGGSDTKAAGSGDGGSRAADSGDVGAGDGDHVGAMSNAGAARRRSGVNAARPATGGVT